MTTSTRLNCRAIQSDPVHTPEKVSVLKEILHERSATRVAAFECPEIYELAYPGYPGDKDFYLRRGDSGRVLYLGVGAGRIFGPLARLNQHAIGVESSEEMNRLFLKRYPDLADRVIHCDAGDLSNIGNPFDTILAPYSFLQVVGRERMPHLLRSAYVRLVTGGRFVTDMFSPYTIPFARPGLETEACHSDSGVRATIYISYDHLSQRMQELAAIEEEGQPLKVLEMCLDYYFPFEVTGALHAAGFNSAEVTGDYCNAPFDAAKNQVLVYDAVKG